MLQISITLIHFLFLSAPKISTYVTDSINEALPTAGEDYGLFCGILAGAENLNSIITYQWTRNGDSYQVETGSSTPSFNPVRLSDVANYSCLIIIASSYLTANIVTMTSLVVTIQSKLYKSSWIVNFIKLHAWIHVVPTPSHVSLTSSKLTTNSIQLTGSDVRLTCAVELHPAVLDSEIFLLMVDTQLSRNGFPLPLTGPTVTGTIFTYTTLLDSFQKSDFGNYTCTTTIRPHPSSTYLTGIDVLSNTLNIKPGKHCMTLNLVLEINFFSLLFVLSYSPSCWCSGHSVQSICPSGCQLEFSNWGRCWRHWI